MLGRFLDLLPDRGAISIFAEPHCRREQHVFEFAQHDYYHIVILIAAFVKSNG
jgi:hypothetical protein